MRKFVIDRATWRCGGTGPHRHGDGNTLLLNEQGDMCCLGHMALQSGCCEFEIESRGTPLFVSRLSQDKLLSGVGDHSGFVDAAITINDNYTLSREEREEKLIELGKKYDVEISFTGEYRD